jgi:CMP-N,N'-diacetyllegionaminic acid synthase
LSGNKVSSEKVILHAIKWYKKNYKLLPDGIILLQPTTPFRNISHYRKCINQFLKSKKSIISVKNINTVLKDIYFKKKNNIKIFKKHDLFIPNGSMYILNTKNFLKFKSIKKIQKNFFEMNGKYNLDIDYYYQYLLANQIAKN